MIYFFRGMCCSFNMEKAEEIFEESKYTKILNKMQVLDASNSYSNSTVPKWFDTK